MNSLMIDLKKIKKAIKCLGNEPQSYKAAP